MTTDETPEVRKISYPVWVNVVDGIPQCSCCQAPMVERPGGWMCAIGAAVLDLLPQWTARLDGLLPDAEEPKP